MGERSPLGGTDGAVPALDLDRFRESDGYDAARIPGYLVDAPGIRGARTEAEIRALAETEDASA